MKNNKAFTLIELLAVIVILGVIATIAVPSVNNIVDKSKKDSFVITANNYVEAVENAIFTSVYEAPVASNDVTVINLNAIEMDKNETTSPYGAKWVNSKSYVAVLNEGTQLEPKYAYYFAAQDEDRHAIPLTKIEDITTDIITYKARNTMEMTVQSLAGNIQGARSTKGIISGLENAIENGQKQDWNVITYTDVE